MSRALLLTPLLLLFSACAPPARQAPPNPFLSARPLNIAHQGGQGIWPSNTMLAYREAVKLGVDMLEMDLHATRDGVLVLSHDATLNRLTSGTGRLQDQPIANLSSIDAGFTLDPSGKKLYPYRGQGIQIAQLSDVLASFPATRMTIEIKQVTPSLTAPLCGLLRQKNMTGKVIVASFHDQTLQEFRQTCPEVTTSMTENELRPLVLLGKLGLGHLAPTPGQVAQVPVRAGGLNVVTPRFIRDMHARGVAVQAWTINDPAQMRELIRLGVDGIITDYPDRLKQVLQEEKP